MIAFNNPAPVQEISTEPKNNRFMVTAVSGLLSCKALQNWAIRPLVAMAATDEVRQGMLHRLQFLQLPVQEVQMLLG